MIKVRAEQNALLLWNRRTAGTAYVSGAELDALEVWAIGGARTGFIDRLLHLGLLGDGDQDAVHNTIIEAKDKAAPLRSFCAPESQHLELTTRCLLHCPQCYQGETTHQDLSLELLQRLIQQAAEAKIFQIALGGGEPLLYPGLEKVIGQIRNYGMACTLTTCGVGLDATRLERPAEAGLDHLQISLNGSTERVNGFARDGYREAIQALELLSRGHTSFGVIWTARRDNLYDFPDLLRLAEGYRVRNVNLLRYKPASREQYAAYRLSAPSWRVLAKMVYNEKKVPIKVDSACSHLLCYLNGRAGCFSGCGAGRHFLAVDASGRLRPCSHVAVWEQAGDLFSTWNDSPQLNRFREVEDFVGAPCRSCRYLEGCRGCRVVVLGVGEGFMSGDIECPFAEA